MGDIGRIAKADVHRITSGQVVLDIQTAVKELVENALDAGATSIEVRFKEHGSEAIEVIDNGSGISPSNYESLALKHYTSKLTTFDDLTSVETFGFRGEALSSLCALANVQMHTATAAEAPMGTILDFDAAGRVTAREKRVARQRGTTVTVENLFHSLPVRRRELLKNIKREYTKAQTLLQAYAVITKGVRWMVSNTVKGRKAPALSVTASNGSNYLVANTGAVFGPKATTSLVPLNLEISLSGSTRGLRRQEQDSVDTDDDGGDNNADDKVLIQGLISKPIPGSGRSSSDRIFLYINGRPWDSAKLSRSFTEVYRSFNTNQAPVVIADFTLGRDRYDVNVSPDKRTMLIHNEADLVEGLKTCLEESFAPSRATFAVSGATSAASKAATAQSQLSFRTQDEGRARPLLPSDDVEEMEHNNSLQRTRGREVDTDNDADNSVDSRASKRRHHNEDDDETLLHVPYTSSPKLSSPRAAALPRASSDRGINDVVREAELNRLEEDEREEEEDEEKEVVPQRSAHGYIDAVIDTTKASWSPEKKKRAPPHDAAGESGLPSISQRLFAANGAAASKAAFGKSAGSLRQFALPGSDVNAQQPKAGHETAAQSQKTLAELEYREEGAGEDIAEMYGGEEDDRAQPEVVEINPDSDMQKRSNERSDEEVNERQHQEPLSIEDQEESDILDGLVENRQETLASLDEEGNENQKVSSEVEERTWKDEILNVNEAGEVMMPFNMELVSQQCMRKLFRQSAIEIRADRQRSSTPGEDAQQEDAGILQRDAERAERELSRVLSKDDFAHMQVVGQFNRGFIVARRRKTGKEKGADDLFIVDQHAADEKYNFETLQIESKIPTQPLLRPRTLELSLVDEMVAMEHVGTIKSKGFELQVDAEAPAGSRVKVVSQPLKLNEKDLEELLFLLREAVPGGPLAMRAQCSKVRTIFASRACRKSVMIGMALNKRQMTTVLRHMGTIDQPWNCPHGRPTLRHLCQVASLGRNKDRSINWSNI